MMLLRAIHAELLKMKRTLALKMVVLAPATVALLVLFMASQGPFSTLHRDGIKNEWTALAHLNLMFWGLMMMPLFITLETALIAGLDHSENQWKALFARPVPRWTFYMAKLLAVVAMTFIATTILLCGILAAGVVLPHLQSEAKFLSPVPLGLILCNGSQVAALMFLALTIQHWVSLRWKSFSVSIGVGIVALAVSFTMIASSRQQGGWPQYFPWSLPMLVLDRQPHDMAKVLLISTALGLLVAAAGCFDFCRREVR